MTRSPDEVTIHTQRGGIRGRGPNQRQYLHNIRTNDLTFGIGPAGTGKTYLAVACAVEALQTDRVRRIVLVRPAVEAGERLGFLPGDIGAESRSLSASDVRRAVRHDGLRSRRARDRAQVIEIAPLAFMRGRSLNDSFIILDEAQNTSVEQMKMFLTRMGFGSKAVVTGDITQTDLPKQQLSGLRHVMKVLPGVEGVAFTHFTSKDVVRHPLVQRIVEAYERKPGVEGSAGGGIATGRVRLSLRIATMQRSATRRRHLLQVAARAASCRVPSMAVERRAMPHPRSLRRWAQAALALRIRSRRAAQVRSRSALA